MPFFAGINDFAADAAAAAAQAAAQAAAYISGPTPTGAAGRLRIEPDQVDAAINIFEDAVEKLMHKVVQAREKIKANPMAADQVSQPAAAAFNHASFAGPGAAIAAWTGAMTELESILRQLRASKEAVVQADNIVSQPFSSSAGALS